MVQSKDPKVPVFRPTKEQINGSFEAYINSIEPKCKKVGSLDATFKSLNPLSTYGFEVL